MGGYSSNLLPDVPAYLPPLGSSQGPGLGDTMDPHLGLSPEQQQKIQVCAVPPLGHDQAVGDQEKMWSLVSRPAQPSCSAQGGTVPKPGQHQQASSEPCHVEVVTNIMIEPSSYASRPAQGGTDHRGLTACLHGQGNSNLAGASALWVI